MIISEAEFKNDKLVSDAYSTSFKSVISLPIMISSFLFPSLSNEGGFITSNVLDSPFTLNTSKHL